MKAIAIIETSDSNDADDKPGRNGEIGRYQIKPWTAWHVGYNGTAKELYQPKINAEWAAIILRMCLDLHGNYKSTFNCYHYGFYHKDNSSIDRYTHDIYNVYLALKNGTFILATWKGIGK